MEATKSLTSNFPCVRESQPTGVRVGEWKVYFKVRDIEMLLDGGINGVVHVQISVADDRRSISLPSTHDPQT